MSNQHSNRMSGGLPASWFTNPIPPRENMNPQERERVAQEHRQRISRISENEQALRDVFQFTAERGWSPPPIDNDHELQRYMVRHDLPLADAEDLVAAVATARRNGRETEQEHQQQTQDIDMLDGEQDHIQSSDAKMFEEFQRKAHRKFTESVKVMESRRDVLLHSFESDNGVLQKLQQESRDRSSQPDSDFVSSISRLQRIRLRAIEMETLQLQRIRTYFRATMTEFKIAVQEYYTAKAKGEHPENPLAAFKSLFNELNPHKSSGIKLALADKSAVVDTELKNSYTLLKVPPQQHNETRKLFPLNQLPSEILSLVLERLSHKSDVVGFLTVCKSWAEIIVKILYYRPHINKKSQLDLFMETMRRTKEQTVFDYRTMIKRLNFSFVGDYMTDDQLVHFVGCPNLERLTLVFCKHVTSSSISAVLQGCKYLQSVDITGIKEVSDSVFNTLAFQCPRVQGFYVPQAREASFNALQTFITHAPLLKRVKITSNPNMNDELVCLLADMCSLLVEVDITLSPNVHDSSLVKLFCQLTQLREFRVTHNTNVTDRFLMDLSQKIDHLPNLRLIDLCGCENITDRTIERLTSLAPKLRNVFLGKCSRITDNSLTYLAKLGKNLQTVHFGHCFNLTDNGIKVLVRSCPRIQYVDFACCTNLTNRTLYELADLTKLKRIGLVKCSQMTDEGLLNMISLRGRNDTLERVHLSYCSNLTIYPIYELLMACPKLSHLSLTAVPSFLRPDITAFCRPAPSDFSENQRQIFCVFSGKGVHKLRHYLMSLTVPTSGPRANVHEILTKFIVSKNLLLDGEELEAGIQRVTNELNQESAAILAATGISPLNGLNNNDFAFQNINFERLDDVFNSLGRTPQDATLTEQDVDRLLPSIDEDFCEDPNSEEFGGVDGIVAPEASDDLNGELAQMVRKFHDLQERVSDFEVNVASLSRVQFQFAGSLLNEMAHIYFQMVDLNRCISQIQSRVYDVGVERDVKGLTIWRLIWLEKFDQLLEKYKLATVVLRLYLKDSIAALTRQREMVIARQRATWEAENREGDRLTSVNDLATRDPEVEGGDGFWQRFEIRNEMRIIQLGLRGTMIPQNGVQPIQPFPSITNDERSTTPTDDDEVLEDA